MRANQFPQAIQISTNRVGWPESEIDRFLANPMAYTAQKTASA
jgi:predicted DNA-binding transcriptional regulator AlpA